MWKFTSEAKQFIFNYSCERFEFVERKFQTKDKNVAAVLMGMYGIKCISKPVIKPELTDEEKLKKDELKAEKAALKAAKDAEGLK
tara:strand:- start:380 stop:634 length:255 start_codon:yes stop_codon:yes gene_type:complete